MEIKAIDNVSLDLADRIIAHRKQVKNAIHNILFKHSNKFLPEHKATEIIELLSSI